MTFPRAELHFHLLPGIDDGPADDAAAVDLARAAAADGTSTVICTPHARFLAGAGDLADRVARLRRTLERAGVPLDVRPGAELSAPDVFHFGPGDLDAFSQGPAGAPWVLLEAPLEPGGVDELHAAVDDLAERGLGVLLAHPERSPQTIAPGGGLDELRGRGVALQVNATSLTGRHGDGARVAGMELIRSGVVAAIASDAHDPAARPPSLSEAVAVLREAGVADPEHLAGRGPQRLLRQGLAAPAPHAARRRAA